MKTMTILGSTGSIGTQALEVAAKHNIKVKALAANSDVEKLAAQAKELLPERVCIYREDKKAELEKLLSGTGIKISTGMEGLKEIARMDGVDIMLNSVVGMVGLVPTLTAIEKGTDIALANKETLVAGGELVIKAAAEKGVKIYPVDSEHSAIFQCLQGNEGNKLKGIILTASGGPFFGKTKSDLEGVTVEQALNHPNWSMGRKITVDSATLMNKGLELMEACHLFHVNPSDVEIVVHRQSVVHSAIVLADNAVIAQLGVPDMKIPIQLALTYPERMPSASGKLSLTDYGRLTFEKPDMEAFPCLAAAVRAAETGGTAGSIVNGANERAVELFLDKKIGFNDIGRGVCAALDEIPVKCADSVDTVLEADKAARAFIDSRYHIC